MLDRAFAALQFLRDFTDAALVYEPANDDQPLVGRKGIDEFGEHCAPFDFVIDTEFFHFIGSDRVAGRFPPAIGERVGGDTQQPGHERCAAPFELPEIGEGLMEDFGRQVLRFFAVRDAACDVGVDALEVVFVQLGETAGVALGGLDHQSLVGFVVQSPQAFSPRGTAFT